jgi:hypothetical protein
VRFTQKNEQAQQEQKQIKVTVDGCPVKLTFAPKPEKTALEDIKRMILTGMQNV